MGLSVTPTLTSINVAPSAALSGDAGGGLPGEFAALLGGQTLAALLLQGDASLAGKGAGIAGDADAKQSDGLPADPAALLGLFGLTGLNQAVQFDKGPAIGRKDGAGDTRQDDILAGNGLLSSISGAGQSGDLGLTADTTQGGDANALSAALLKTEETAARSSDAANIAAKRDGDGASQPAFANALAAAHTQQNADAENRGVVATPLHNPGWSQEFGDKIVWLARNDQQTAQISLNPPQLGPVHVTLNLNGDQATAVFASPHAEVRQAIESSLSQLRDALSSAGINLGDANVGANPGQQNPNMPFQHTPHRLQSAGENAILPANDSAPVARSAMPLQQGRGMVDLFA